MGVSLSANQRGFTLIEMSIVLVIIGLIVGGILKGQELIESSRQKNLMSQLDRIKSGTTTFVDRYKGLPGDFSRVALLPNSGSLGTGGNDNGVIGEPASSSIGELANLTDTVVSANENVKFFNQLLAADMISGGSVTPSTTTLACFSGLCGTNSPLPAAAFPSSGLTLNYGSHPGNTVNGQTAQPKLAHWLIVSRFTTGALAGGTADGVLSGARAFQIDNKYDDGLSGSGNIRSSLLGGNNCGNTGGGDYAPAATGTECHLMFALE